MKTLSATSLILILLQLFGVSAFFFPFIEITDAENHRPYALTGFELVFGIPLPPFETSCVLARLLLLLLAVGLALSFLETRITKRLPPIVSLIGIMAIGFFQIGFSNSFYITNPDSDFEFCTGYWLLLFDFMLIGSITLLAPEPKIPEANQRKTTININIITQSNTKNQREATKNK